jgi:hypothetical protein
MKNESRSHVVVFVTSDAATLTSALVHLRAGNMERVLDLLERGLDRCVLCLSHLRKESDPIDQRGLTMALKAVRDYRRQHPRRTTAGTCGVDLSAVHEVEALARKAIEELED